MAPFRKLQGAGGFSKVNKVNKVNKVTLQTNLQKDEVIQITYKNIRET